MTTEGYPFVFHKDYSVESGCYGLKPYIDNLVWIHETLASGATTTRWNDEKTIVLERLGSPGLLTGISTDRFGERRVTCATAFGAHVQLHDYTGHHPDLWTDEQGRATFAIPPNVAGRAQSYVCFSRANIGHSIVVGERPGGVTHVPASAGTPCGEGTVCGGTPTCDSAAHCQPAVPPAVDDGNPCTVDESVRQDASCRTDTKACGSQVPARAERRSTGKARA